MRNVNITKTELMEEAGCTVGFALFAEQTGLEVGHRFDIDARRWEEDIPAWGGGTVPSRLHNDWTKTLTFVQSGGPRGAYAKSDRTTKFSAEMEIATLTVGSACAARKTKQSFVIIAMFSSGGRALRCGPIAKSIYGGNEETRVFKHVRLDDQARALARHEPFFETVMWFAGLLHENDVRNGLASFQEIVEHYAEMGGRLPLPVTLFEEDRDEPLKSVSPIFEEA